MRKFRDLKTVGLGVQLKGTERRIDQIVLDKILRQRTSSAWLHIKCSKEREKKDKSIKFLFVVQYRSRLF